MKNLIRRVLVLIILLSFIFPTYAEETSKTFNLTIIHSNDFHGFESTGLARQANIVSQARKEITNMLFLNAGDVFTRGIYQKMFYGELEFAELNAMGLDAFTVGNNEFKATNHASTAQSYLFSRFRQAKFPVLCANVRQGNGSYLPNVKPFIVKEIGGVKIGIFGVTTNKIKTYNQVKGLIVEDQWMALKKIYPKVAAESDIIIGLTHIGFDDDKLLAARAKDDFPRLAVIVGGDSHTVLHQPVNVNGIPIVQAGGEEQQYLGQLDLTFEYIDNVWKLKDYKGKLIPINSSVPEDPQIETILDSYLAKFDLAA